MGRFFWLKLLIRQEKPSRVFFFRLGFPTPPALAPRCLYLARSQGLGRWPRWPWSLDWRMDGHTPWSSNRSKGNYCWWKKSCTSWYVVYPIIYRVSYIPGGAGFQPSTVVFQPWFFRGYVDFRGCRWGWAWWRRSKKNHIIKLYATRTARLLVYLQKETTRTGFFLTAVSPEFESPAILLSEKPIWGFNLHFLSSTCAVFFHVGLCINKKPWKSVLSTMFKKWWSSFWMRI